MFEFVAKQVGDVDRVLDVGASYGHLLQVLAETGAKCDAVEVVDRLRQRLLRFSQNAYASIDQIPPDARYDAITMIDSLYYFRQPRTAIVKLAEHLSKDGRLVVRMTNRTPFLNAAVRLGRPISGRLFGDQEVAVSARGLALLLEAADLKIRRRYVWERKRLRTWSQRLGYPALALASLFARADLTPGLFWLAVRR